MQVFFFEKAKDWLVVDHFISKKIEIRKKQAMIKKGDKEKKEKRMSENINLKINKKLLLLGAVAATFFAMGQYVSVVNAGAAGGVIVDGATEEEIAEAILATMPVGSVTFRMDAIDPTTIYGGTWQLITGDASVRFGDGSAQSGIASGNNTPIVPVPYHRHSINHDHPSVVTNTDTHSHTQYVGQGSGNSSGRHGWNISGRYSTQTEFGATSSDSHNHSVNLPNYSGNSGYAGTDGTRMDVRGAGIALNVWKRTL